MLSPIPAEPDESGLLARKTAAEPSISSAISHTDLAWLLTARSSRVGREDAAMCRRAPRYGAHGQPDSRPAPKLQGSSLLRKRTKRHIKRRAFAPPMLDGWGAHWAAAAF